MCMRCLCVSRPHRRARCGTQGLLNGEFVPEQVAAMLVLMRAKVGSAPLASHRSPRHAAAGCTLLSRGQHGVVLGGRSLCWPFRAFAWSAMQCLRRVTTPSNRLCTQGETPEEVAGMAQALLKTGVAVQTPHSGE